MPLQQIGFDNLVFRIRNFVFCLDTKYLNLLKMRKKEILMKIVKLEKSLTEQAYDILLDKICTGELASGERLNQDELANQLSVSRQPINSAISILKSNGFVEETGRRGVIVSPINLDHFNSIYEFRSAIEPFAIQLAFKRMPETANLEAAQALERGWSAVKSGDLKEQIAADFNFHQMIYNWTKNSTLIAAMNTNWFHIRRAIGLVVNTSVPAEQSWVEHERILNAMMIGELKLSEAEMESHLKRAKDATLDLMTDQI